jgi:hypothetical protein
LGLKCGVTALGGGRQSVVTYGTVPVHTAIAKQHAHHHKDEVIATATKAIIARFLRVVTLYSMANSLYYLYLAGRLIFLPQVLTLGRGAGAACEDAAAGAAPLLACFDLGLLGGPCEALRLHLWVFVDGFLVFWASIQAARAANLPALSLSHYLLLLSRYTSLLLLLLFE